MTQQSFENKLLDWRGGHRRQVCSIQQGADGHTPIILTTTTATAPAIPSSVEGDVRGEPVVSEDEPLLLQLLVHFIPQDRHFARVDDLDVNNPGAERADPPESQFNGRPLWEEKTHSPLTSMA